MSVAAGVSSDLDSSMSTARDVTLTSKSSQEQETATGGVSGPGGAAGHSSDASTASSIDRQVVKPLAALDLQRKPMSAMLPPPPDDADPS